MNEQLKEEIRTLIVTALQESKKAIEAGDWRTASFWAGEASDLMSRLTPEYETMTKTNKSDLH